MALICSGKVTHGFSIVRALALGADACNSARGMMFALGCIQALKCNRGFRFGDEAQRPPLVSPSAQALKCNSNHCPTGITTHLPEPESGLDVPAKAPPVANFQRATVHAAQEIIGAAGCTAPNQISADMIFRRESGVHVRSYADLHERYFPMLPCAALRLSRERARGAAPRSLGDK